MSLSLVLGVSTVLDYTPSNGQSVYVVKNSTILMSINSTANNVNKETSAYSGGTASANYILGVFLKFSQLEYEGFPRVFVTTMVAGNFPRSHRTDPNGRMLHIKEPM